MRLFMGFIYYLANLYHFIYFHFNINSMVIKTDSFLEYKCLYFIFFYYFLIKYWVLLLLYKKCFSKISSFIIEFIYYYEYVDYQIS